MSNSLLNDVVIGQYRALIIEKDPDQMRIWISKLNKFGVDVLASSDISDAHKKLLQLNNRINFVIANRNVLAFSKVANSEDKFFSFIDKLSYQPLLVFYPKFNYADKNYAKKIFMQLDLPVNDKDLSVILVKIKDAYLKNNQLLAQQHPLITVLKPFLVFRSQLMLEGLMLLPQIAKTDYSVLITGQTGTGKEMAAKAVHFLSRRSKEKFVTINCGAIPESLIESELFGHEKGAFTGALHKRIGKFEEASKGTLFLDEIGEMPLNMQVRLLRALEDKAITPLGSNKVLDTNPRVIAATQVDLASAVKQGRFRDDLYYRLNVLYLHLPPLSQRQVDIELLASHFLSEAFNHTGRSTPYPNFETEALKILQNYSWPGNVRELKNVVIRIASTLPTFSKTIGADFVKKFIPQRAKTLNLKADVTSKTKAAGVFLPWGVSMQEAKDILVEQTLKKTNYNVKEAAKILKVSTRNLSRIVKRLNIKVKI